MTLKFESEILFDLMNRDGDDAPSDVLPYESELKEKYLSQVVGAYPKLQDYRPEWLNYNLYHHLPSDFPTESVTNVTSASFHDVVPYAYKSAILKGETLVNLIDNQMYSFTQFGSAENDGEYVTITSAEETSANVMIGITVKQPLEPNTQYTLIYLDRGLAPRIILRDVDNATNLLQAKNTGIMTFTTQENSTKNLTLYYCNVSVGQKYKHTNNVMIINGDVSNLTFNNYFEDMKSVQMPVLTTSNEDGTKTNILTVNEDVTLRGIGDVQDKLDCLTGEVTERIGEVVLDGRESWKKIGWSTYDLFEVDVSSYKIKNNLKLLCDKIPVKDVINKTEIGIGTWGSNIDLAQTIVIHNGISTTVDELKEWLSQNPITVQYQLATESNKTVDLTCINEQGENETFRPIEGTMHVNTSSQSLPPFLDMSVPVEATSQNLMSFANIEEEEK